MGAVVWAMVETEADDALASAARLASLDPRAQKICIWTPDKDLAQAVQGDRVVQIDRKGKKQTMFFPRVGDVLDIAAIELFVATTQAGYTFNG